MSKKIKLTYFNLKGKAEIIRFILVANDVNFEDCRVPFEEWPQLKLKIPTGQLPLLELPCGTILNESCAITRHLAKKYHLAGSNEMDEFKTDRAFCTLEDILQKIVDIFHETDERKKEQLRKDLHETHLPVFLKRLTIYLNENEGDFFLGNQISYADLHLVNILENFESSYNGFPKIANCIQKVLQRYPNLVKYRASRPVTIV